MIDVIGGRLTGSGRLILSHLRGQAGLRACVKAAPLLQGDTNSSSALDVVFFVREIMETNPKLRPTILARLLDTFSQIRSSRVCSCALWILSEYCTSPQDINAALEVVSLRTDLCNLFERC